MCFLSLCRLELLTWIIFLLSEELLLTFLARQVCWQQILEFGARKSFSFTFSPSIFKCKFYWIQNSRLMSFFTECFKLFIPLSPCLYNFQQEVWCVSYSSFLLSKVFFFPSYSFFPLISSLFFIFYSLNVIYLVVGFWNILIGIHMDSNYLELLAVRWDNFLQCFL